MSWCRPTPALRASHGLNGSTASTISPSPTSTSSSGSICGTSWSSVGGWIASELAVRDTTRLSSIVLVDAIGIQVEGHPIADVFPLTPDELSALSYHNPAPFRIDPATLSPDQVAGMAANFRALGVYGRDLGMR